MAKTTTPEQHLLLHSRWPNDCCLCAAEARATDAQADLLALARYHKAYVSAQIARSFHAGHLLADALNEEEAAQAALSDRVKRMLEDSDE